MRNLFGANTIEENLTLQALQNMPVNQRRHATIILLGNSFQTFTPMEAFKHSVHAVINSSEMFLLKQLVEKAVADNELFLHSFREVQNRIYTTGNRLSCLGSDNFPASFMIRLDQALVERGLCESRERAKRAILAGQVRVNAQRAHKPSDPVKPDDELALDAGEKFVSRGGHKLEHALRPFPTRCRPA